jgi:hypothetical protein
MFSALSIIRHRIAKSDDARYLTIGPVRERFGGFPARSNSQTQNPSSHFWQLSNIETMGTRTRTGRVMNTQRAKAVTRFETCTCGAAHVRQSTAARAP